MSDLETLAQRFPDSGFAITRFRDNTRLHIAKERAHDLLQHLKEQHGFDMLADLTAVDYLNYPDAVDRFGVVYCLLNVSSGERVYVKTMLNEPDLRLPTATDLWKGANWMEREVFDLYGIGFDGHPDLRRILMPEEFVPYALRKDYPLRGRGERHNFPVLSRAES